MMNLSPLKPNGPISRARKIANKGLADRKAALAELQAAAQAVDNATTHRDAVAQAQAIAQQVAATVQQQAHTRLAQVVSRCLEAVFDEPYEIRITFDRSRGKTEARLELVRGELVVDPLTAAGGGVVDVAAFALRVAAVCYSQPPGRKLFVLDEPFKFVSGNYIPRVRQLLLVLAKELDVQFIIVTHIEKLVTGNIVEVGNADSI